MFQIWSYRVHNIDFGNCTEKFPCLVTDDLSNQNLSVKNISRGPHITPLCEVCDQHDQLHILSLV